MTARDLKKREAKLGSLKSAKLDGVGREFLLGLLV